MVSSSQKPSSSSTSIPKYNFEVFLSFRGEDTRYNFTDHLFVNLDRMGIKTFRDDQLERGEEIKPELLKTIEESRISIVVFSKNYAHSKWCLDELAKIMECREEMGQIVLPVFYHVDPSHVRNQRESFGEAFSIHERNVDAEKVQRWRDSLTKASNLSGFHVNDGYESKHIEEIIKKIFKRSMNFKSLPIGDDIVGVDFRLKKLTSSLSSDLNDVRVVGIYGTGGIGKTTIAKILYNEIQWQFTGASFLQDVRETCKNGRQLKLQRQLLHDTVGNDVKFVSIHEGVNIIKGKLGSKRILVVFDDVDKEEQLESLVGSPKSFGRGSTIIITTRDQHLLRQYGVHISYEATELDDEDALLLFSRHAFKQDVPEEDYVNLSKCMVRYAQGLPLALKVLGSHLCGMKTEEWKEELVKLKKHLVGEVDTVLRISFDGLDYYQKEVFLDIACFFNGECKDVVLRILDGCNLFATTSIRVLHDRCLVTTLGNGIHMHDLIQETGWAIVREECPGDPCKWSRLWDIDDICNAFSGQEVMENIQIISLDLSKSKEIEFSAEVFAKMKKLRLLKIYCNDHDGLTKDESKVLLPKSFEFPHNLRYLHWERCTLKSLPSSFVGKHLIEINLKSSNIKRLWKGKKCLGKLEGIDLSNSKQLVKMPKFSSMLNLERLNLKGCTSLRELHSSIGDLKKLTYLNLVGCEQLQSFPASMKFESLEVLHLNRCPNLKKFPVTYGSLENLKALYLNKTGIKGLPSSIEYLECLEILDLSGCSKFEEFPEIRGNMKCLKELDLKGTAIKELPNSIGSLTSLQILSLEKCSKFERFSDIFTNLGLLWHLDLSESGVKELPNSIGSLTSLVYLSLENCSKFKRFSNTFTNMGLLKKLNLSKSGVKELPGSIGYLESLENLDLSFCSNFEKFLEIQGNIECLKLSSKRTAIKDLPNSIGCSEEAFEDGCSNFEELPEIRNNMSLCRVDLRETAIKELPCWITHCTQLYVLNLDGCTNLRTLKICRLKSLFELSLNDCSSLEAFWEIEEDIEDLKILDLSGSNLTELPSSIEHLRGLEELQLCSCEKLVSLPNSIGNLTCLKRICACYSPKLHNLPDDLRSLHSCLTHLELGGCNLTEGKIPSDLWCLSLLIFLNLSENDIRRVPAGISQLSQLRTLLVNHCPLLEEIGELPSSLGLIDAHDCPRLGTGSFLLKHFKHFKPFESPFPEGFRILVPGSGGIPNWVSHRRMGCEFEIELPKNWYEDNNLLGFVLFFYYVRLAVDERTTHGRASVSCGFTISRGDQSEQHAATGFMFLRPVCKQHAVTGCFNLDKRRDHGCCGTSDPAMWVVYFPRTDIPFEHRSGRWNTLKALTVIGCSCHIFGDADDNTCFKLVSCGIHLLRADQIPCPQPSRGSPGDREDPPAKKLKIL